jgi:hypothetical protein
MLSLRDATGEFNSHLEEFKRLLGEKIIDGTNLQGILENWNNLLSGTINYFQALQTYLGVTAGQVGNLPSRQTQWGPQKPTPVVHPRFMQGGGDIIVGEHGAERISGGQVRPADDPMVKEIRRMLRTLPVILRDAVEKAK